MNLDTIIPMNNTEANAIINALRDDKDSKRSRTTFSLANEGLQVHINADDSVAMRAAINSNLRLINSCLKSIKVIQNA
jgi:tRNA threonylcarbamoyladenosine modification (KEOPS) complex  Pcc1 subunit